MPRQIRVSTEYSGVYFVKLANQDQSFFIRYKRNGKSVEEKAGRSNQGMNAEKAYQLRTERLSETSAAGNEINSNSDLHSQQDWTFSKIFSEYLRLRSKLKGRANDIYRFKNYLEKEFANITPSCVTQDDIRRFKHNIQNRELKPATIRHVLELLRRLANFAAKNNLCSGLSFKIQMPKVENYKTEELTNSQLQKLMQVLEEESDIQVSNLVRLALYTGMKRGELFNLNWVDIDFYNKTITVKSDKKGDQPTIPLNEMAEKVLVEHAHTENGSKFVFPGRGGKKRTECKRPLLRIRKKAGLPDDFRILQGLRHVYASMLVSSGKVDLETLQSLLTQKSPLMTQRYAYLLDESRTNSENIIADAENNLSNATEEENYVSETVNAEILAEEVQDTDFPVEDLDTEHSEEERVIDSIRETTFAEPLEKENPETDIPEEQDLTEFLQVAELEVGLHKNVFSKSHEAEQEEDYSPEHIEKVTEFDAEEEFIIGEEESIIVKAEEEFIIAEEEFIIAEEESKETVAEEVKIYFQDSNESTESIVKVHEKESQEYSKVSAAVKEKTSQSHNAFSEFFKQNETLKTQPKDVLKNPSTPAELSGFTGDVDSKPKPKVKELNEDLIDVSAANQDGDSKEANDESEIMSNEQNQYEINVISTLEDAPTLNVDEQMLEEGSVDNKAEELSEEVPESTNLPVFLSTEPAEEQEEIFSNQSMPVPVPEKAKNQVVVIQSFKQYLSGVSSTDDEVYSSEITTNNKDVENKTKPKVRPSIKELKNDLILLSKMIKEAPKREKKNSDQKQSQF
ncbi:MAG: site-specific integrase [SAR324 cluster bacterium]|nr:site-specific integrase [SAR324 cluster bacterium]